MSELQQPGGISIEQSTHSAMFRVGLPRNILRCARISRHIPFHSLPPHLLLESFKLLKTIQQQKVKRTQISKITAI